MWGLEVEIFLFFFFFFFFIWKNDDPQWTPPRNPPCLRLHLIDRRKDPPEKLPAPFYSPRGPIKSWTRIPKDLVLKEPPTQYFSREMFEYLETRICRLNLCQTFFQFSFSAIDAIKIVVIFPLFLFSFLFILRSCRLCLTFSNVIDSCDSRIKNIK